MFKINPNTTHYLYIGVLFVILNQSCNRKTGGLTDSVLSKQDTLWQSMAPFFSPPAEYKNDFGSYRSPMQFYDGRTVNTPEDWIERRQEILDQWHSMMSPWPAPLADLEVEYLDTLQRENIIQYTVRFHWTPVEKTTGYLLIPEGSHNKPAVVTVYYEPETAIGNGRPFRDFAIQLARRGFVTLSIGTTETTENETYATYYPSRDSATVAPLSMLAYAASSAWQLLADLPEVDDKKIGIVGHSYGGKWAMFASCLFEKFACAAWSDPGIVFDEQRPSVNYWEPWYLGYHRPPWRTRGEITEDNPAYGLYPELVAKGFDLHELHTLMAPRPFLVSGGSEDGPHRWKALNHTIAINKLLGYSNRVAMTNRQEHAPNEESNKQIYRFFEWFLR